MTVRIDSLGNDRLSVRDRLDLIEQIWDSLPNQVEPQDIPDWHVAELAKRRAIAAESPASAGRGGTCWSGLKVVREPAGNPAARSRGRCPESP